MYEVKKNWVETTTKYTDNLEVITRKVLLASANYTDIHITICMSVQVVVYTFLCSSLHIVKPLNRMSPSCIFLEKV